MLGARDINIVRKYAQGFPNRTPSQIADDARVQFTPYVAAIIAEARRAH